LEGKAWKNTKAFAVSVQEIEGKTRCKVVTRPASEMRGGGGRKRHKNTQRHMALRIKKNFILKRGLLNLDRGKSVRGEGDPKV